jgi:hypothetical protein
VKVPGAPWYLAALLLVMAALLAYAVAPKRELPGEAASVAPSEVSSGA